MKKIIEKKILLIVSGGIAAYKTLDLIRNLKKKNYEIKTILTKTAKEFITPLSVSSLSKNKVYENKFDIKNEIEMDHIALSRWSDIILITPATANLLSRIANGTADDFISTIISASDKDIFIAPAMNVEMWENNTTQENVQKLIRLNYKFIGPAIGELACGEVGKGKMSSINEVEKTLDQYFFGKNKIFSKIKAIVTAGPTREYLDPIRYISNESSGKQGLEIAKKLLESGFNTTLITGPTNLKYPKELKIIKVTSAKEMLKSCQKELPSDIAICTAAVSDFYPTFQKDKIKKENLKNQYSLLINKNTDILKYLSTHNKYRPKLVIGFAAETKNILENSLKKLKNKNCDWIIANDVSNKKIGFNSNDNEVTIIYENQRIEKISKTAKSEIAAEIVDRIIEKFKIKNAKNFN